ncbi:MAG: hypothetical protein JXB03_00460 [Spirochaetales bacterium]|nr:hypothetical protein [Spirochaetales bacterium]
MMVKYHVFVPLIAAIFLSCSNHLPQVSNIQWELTQFNDKNSGTISEELAIFFLVKDEDGEDDIEEIYIIHDDRYEYWKLDEASWTRQTLDNEVWIGSSRLTKEGMFPRSEYRYLVIDKTGDRTDGTFFIDVESFDKQIGFPTASVGEETIELLQGSNEEFFFSVYDAMDTGIILSKVKKGTYNIEQLVSSDVMSKARYFFLIEKNASKGFYLKSGPFYFSNASDNETDGNTIP